MIGNINQKLLSSQMVWEMKRTLGPLNWKQTRKKPFYCKFYHTFPIRCVSRIPLYKFDGFRCLFNVYTLACCPLGGVTQIVRLHILFFGTLDVFYREKIIKINDNKTPKAHRQTPFIHDKSLDGMRSERKKKYENVQRLMGDILSLSYTA